MRVSYCSYDEDDDILTVSSVLLQHLVTIEVNLEGPFVVGGLRVCLSGSETTAAHGRYTVQSLDYCHFVYTPDEVLSVNTVTNIEMTKIINRTAANSVNAERGETFSGIWLPTWTTDKSSLWESDVYTSVENEYLRSLNWAIVIDLGDATVEVLHEQRSRADRTWLRDCFQNSSLLQ